VSFLVDAIGHHPILVLVLDLVRVLVCLKVEEEEEREREEKKQGRLGAAGGSSCARRAPART
jgi:hypothetical protein